MSSSATAQPPVCDRRIATTAPRCSSSTGICRLRAATSASSASRASTTLSATSCALIDSGDAFTLLAEIDRHIVAIGQYFPGDTPDRAEVAFAISDVHQGRGIGTKLLERLGAAARKRGITSFEAYLLRTTTRRCVSCSSMPASP